MFAARGIAVSFSVLVMVYAVLSLFVCVTWQRVRSCTRRYTVRRAADLLFALRVFPLVVAAAITAALTVPSFLLLEPRTIDEPLGAVPLVLGLAGILLGILGLVNAGLSLRRASRTIASWMSDAQPVASSAPVPVLRISRVVPALTAAGIVRPKLLLSGSAECLLTVPELQIALNHELAHVRRRDNLKKLLLRVVAFPGMSALEAAWLEATEIAADDAAVSDAGEALDLASALIKLSRLGPVEPPLDLTAALVHSPASVMNARVERLLAWNNDHNVRTTVSRRYALIAVLVTIAAALLTYHQLLLNVHAATEWLVR